MLRVPGTVLDTDPKVLNQRHREIMRRLLLAQPLFIIAKAVGLSATRLGQVINSPIFQDAFQIMQADADANVTSLDARLRLYADEALEENIKLMRESENEKIRQTSAWDILNRAGFVPAANTPAPTINNIVLSNEFAKGSEDLVELLRKMTDNPNEK